MSFVGKVTALLDGFVLGDATETILAYIFLHYLNLLKNSENEYDAGTNNRFCLLTKSLVSKIFLTSI
ncbi:MAG: hypothetical protein DA328_09430 [Nitrososphaeraceae archaeon]|nr:hypothetical protein [Nitrososphaeraceae archaeon]